MTDIEIMQTMTDEQRDLVKRRDEEIEALIAGQETLQRYIARLRAELEGTKKLYQMAVAERDANMKAYLEDICSK